MNDEWKLVTPEMMTLRNYPCGINAGDIVSLRNDLHYNDHKGKPTGKIRSAGDDAMVLTGNPREPDIVWIRWRDGERATWDSTIFDFFEVTGHVT